MATASTLLGSAVFKVGASSLTAVDYTDNATKVVATVMKEELDASTFGNTYRYRVGGLSDVTITATLLANASIVNALYALVGTNVYAEAKRDSAATSATNVLYKVTGGLLASVDVVNQEVGGLSEIEVVVSGGALTTATS
jgi:hypothetical protein